MKKTIDTLLHILANTSDYKLAVLTKEQLENVMKDLRGEALNILARREQNKSI